MTMRRIEAKVSGRVQGVGFRQFTLERARRRGITGWVRNEPDGSVQVVAEGDDQAIGGLVDDLQQGPPLASVRDVQMRQSEASGEFDAFAVRY